MVSNAKGNSLFAGASRAAARAMLLSIVCHKGVEGGTLRHARKITLNVSTKETAMYSFKFRAIFARFNSLLLGTDPLVATFLAEDGSQSHFKRSKSEACKITFISFLMSFSTSLVAKFMEENTKQLDGQDPICCTEKIESSNSCQLVTKSGYSSRKL